jgi:cell division transport system ATP-binding protein
MPLLRFDNVSKLYSGGQAALSDISFSVNAGEMLFITGHSGAGKSTVLRMIETGERPSRGTVIFNDRNLAKLSRRQLPYHRRTVGAVFQDHRLLMDRSVYENVALPLIIAAQPSAHIQRRVRHVLERVGLASKEKSLPKQLSAGEQQRVGIARAVASQPVLLLADEPTGNLDPTLAADIMQLFMSLPEQGTTVMIASHDLMLVKRMRKRVLVLSQGKLMDDIQGEELAE